MIEQLQDIVFKFLYNRQEGGSDGITIVVGTELYHTIMMDVNCRVYSDYKNPTIFDLPFRCEPRLGEHEYEIRATLRKGELK